MRSRQERCRLENLSKSPVRKKGVIAGKRGVFRVQRIRREEEDWGGKLSSSPLFMVGREHY